MTETEQVYRKVRVSRDYMTPMGGYSTKNSKFKQNDTQFTMESVCTSP